MADYSLLSSSIGLTAASARAGRWVHGSVLGSVRGGAGRVLWTEKQATLRTAGNTAPVLPVISFRVTSHPSSGAALMACTTYSRPPGCALHQSSLPSGMRHGSG